MKTWENSRNRINRNILAFYLSYTILVYPFTCKDIILYTTPDALTLFAWKYSKVWNIVIRLFTLICLRSSWRILSSRARVAVRRISNGSRLFSNSRTIYKVICMILVLFCIFESFGQGENPPKGNHTFEVFISKSRPHLSLPQRKSQKTYCCLWIICNDS